MTLDELNGADAAAARASLAACCGSARWVEAVLTERPFATLGELEAAGERAFHNLREEDWLEAFAAHPRIGERGNHNTAAGAWSAGEQSGIDSAAARTAQTITRLNREYFDRFGFIFIVCATGKSGDQMREILAQRITNDRSTELRNAAAEQSAITRLRLRKLISA